MTDPNTVSPLSQSQHPATVYSSVLQKDNLTRIRDNQRRSRARRKEYLQELEVKYRSCEQLGVQASAEIQQAAKRVLDENRRLRALLHQKGVSDAEIDSFVEPDLSSSESLDTMLNTRRPCKPQSACGTKASSSSSNTCSSSTKNPVQQVPIAIPLPSAPPQQFRVEAVAPVTHFSPSNPANAASAFDPSYTYYNVPMQSSWAYSPTNDMSVDLTPQSPNTSSCLHAANIIRGMRNDVGPELEQDLGCSDAAHDCKVDNTVVFELVDKYSMRDL